MPIEFRIDHDNRRVLAKGLGRLSDEDVFDYQRDVWSREDVAGYDELMDMRQVDSIESPSTERIRELASLSAEMDSPKKASKFAIVATTPEAFGLGRMYEAYRGLHAESTKQVGVFKTMDEALAFLSGETPTPRRG